MTEDVEIITLDDQQAERLAVIDVDWDDKLRRTAPYAIFTTEVDKWCLENLSKSVCLDCVSDNSFGEVLDYQYEVDVSFGSEDDLLLFTLRWL